MSLLQKVLDTVASLSEEVLRGVDTEFKNVYLPENKLLLLPGEVNDNLYFVEAGVLRAFYYHGTEELTSWMVAEGAFAYSVQSFLRQIPSLEGIQTWEPCRLRVLSREGLHQLLTQYPELNAVMRQLTEQYLLRYDTRVHSLRGMTPLERWERFQVQYPELCGRVALKYIASYIDITPSTLSRVRTGRMKNKC